MMVNLPCLLVSCTNFLRPTCSYTECWPSFQTGSCPTERTTVSYSSCLSSIITDLPFHRVLCSVDASPCFTQLVCLLMQRLITLHRLRVSFQNPARHRIFRCPARLRNGFDVVFIVMLPVQLLQVSWCPRVVSVDHTLPHSLRWQILPATLYTQ